MSNIVEPQILPSNQGSFVTKDSNGNIVETKPTSTWFSEYIKNNPSLIFGGFPAQPNSAFQQNNGEPYVFLKDFSFINSTTDGSFGSNMVNYKKYQVVYPFPQPLANEKRVLEPSFKEALDKGILVPQKIAQQQQAVLQAKSFEKLTAEDRLYEKLGIKYHNTHMFGVASRLKGRLLLAVILIGTYFAYKKIK